MRSLILCTLASILPITISCTTTKLTTSQRDLAQVRLSTEFPKKERELLLAVINEDIPKIEKLFPRVPLLGFWGFFRSASYDYKVRLSLTALYVSSPSHRVEILKRLHELGLNLDIVVDRDGRQISHLSALEGYADVLRLLHVLGYNNNLPDRNGIRPTTIAVKEGEAGALKSLHDSGHDLNYVDKDGRRASHWAAMIGDTESIILLHDLGYDLDIPDKFGLSPVDIAKQAGETKALRALRKLGYKSNTKNMGETKIKILKGCY